MITLTISPNTLLYEAKNIEQPGNRNVLIEPLESERFERPVESRITLAKNTRQIEPHPLIDAIFKRDDKEVESLIKSGIDVNKARSDGLTALMAAARAHNPHILRMLIDAGADVNVKDENGQTALMHASYNCHRRNRNSVEYFEIHNRDYREVVGVLISAKINVNAEDNKGRTALMYSKDGEVSGALISAGAIINTQDDNGWTALMYAVIDGKGDNFWGGYDQPLWFDSIGNIDVVEVLLSSGADIGIKNKDGHTALYIAKNSRTGNFDGYGLSANLVDGRIVELLKKTRQIVPSASQSQESVAEKKPDPGESPIIYAVKHGNIEMIKHLISSGCDLDIKDEFGKTPLMYAFDSYNLKSAELLIRAGADVNAVDRDGLSILVKLADRHDSYRGIKMLVGAGANVNDRDKQGNTVLMIVAAPGKYIINIDLVKFLIKSGADLAARGNDGKTALERIEHITYSNHVMEAAKILKRAQKQKQAN